MVCFTKVLSASLAIFLLRLSMPPSEPFVFSPLSLNTLLAIVHDGANGVTQSELTNLLLNGCTPSDVTEFYSSFTLSLPSTNATGVTLSSANRFYVDDSMKLRYDYKTHIQRYFAAQILRTNLRNKSEAARNMSKFVEEATHGKIRNLIKDADISDDALGILINAVYFLGKWKFPFDHSGTHERTFKGANGGRKISFMSEYASFRVNQKTDLGTVLIVPYQDSNYSFFYLMPSESSDLGTMMSHLTGKTLIYALRAATDFVIRITVPKIKLESQLDVKPLLSNLGVRRIFENDAELSKISRVPLTISKIKHSALIEMDEEGTEAVASTYMKVQMKVISASIKPNPVILIDRPFLFGVLRNEDIIFIGQFT
ncbi:hypothetical protein PMAYCL1PPCAC_08363 [Pristionchus mayeri]|uniref:Serpin domain-containing protein n=1 Tax=Pristionchus mayeri TaxID=1317129 RepID=A0AAN4ZBL1_9BILA|nr:hypothetical protein PMAYCL1PPCAC_08363 [Pristionchus mayeri]